MATIFGTINNDTITPAFNSGGVVGGRPTAGGDYIDGLGGNDSIDGGGDNDTIYGGDGNDTVLGNTGDDYLDGGSGIDTLIGDLGDDTYVVDISSDVITENLGEGTDSVFSNANYTLSTNLENLTLTGVDNRNGTGNALDNTLIGNVGNNSLRGGGGNDWLDGGSGDDNLLGGLGDDSYIVDSSSDVITENAGQGMDLVSSSANYALSANVENLTLTGVANLNGTGNAQFNVISGNTGNNSLSGGGGNDTLNGGDGNDTLDGGDGNDTLNGGDGNNSMVGGLGNDSYLVDSSSDVITENEGEGNDHVTSSTHYVLSANLETLTLSGVAAINGVGNVIDNVIIGNSGNNSLSGGEGNDTLNGGDGNDSLNGGDGDDTMIGGIGNDSFTVGSAGDVVTENANPGTDLVSASISYALDTNVENLTLLGGGAINGKGNTLNNTLNGNNNNNSLNGGSGNDTLNGLSGNDTLMGGGGDDSLDGGLGIDRVFAKGNFITLTNTSLTGNGTNVLTGIEEAELSGARKGNTTLNASAFTLGSVILDGGSGNDTLIGGSGNDTLNGGKGFDRVVESGDVNFILTNTSLTGNGNDTLIAIEKVTLTGGTGNNILNASAFTSGQVILNGGAGNDTLTGSTFVIYGRGRGNDTLTGGSGNDSLDGRWGNDWVVESGDVNFTLTDTSLTGNGTDVLTSIEFATLTGGIGNNTLNASAFTLGNVILDAGSGNDALTGGTGDDKLWGGDGNDIINGRLGNDYITGGIGIDTFTFNTSAVFSNSDGIDRLADFVHNSDKILLDKTTFTALTSIAGNGFSVGSEFAVVSFDNAAKQSSALIVYSSFTGNLFYNQNGSAAGLGTGAQFADLTGNPTLSASDFVIQA